MVAAADLTERSNTPECAPTGGRDTGEGDSWAFPSTSNNNRVGWGVAGRRYGAEDGGEGPPTASSSYVLRAILGIFKKKEWGR